MLSGLPASIRDVVDGLSTTVPREHRVRSGDNPLQAEMRRIVESIYGPPLPRLPGLDIGRAYYRACEAAQQAEALTRYAYEYASEQLHDDVAALVVKVQSDQAA
jgi:hypothetical protein